MNDREVKILTERLIPVPKNITFRDGSEYRISSSRKCKTVLRIAETDGAEELAEKLFREYWNAEAEIVTEQDTETGSPDPDAYKVEVTADLLTIAAKGRTGLLNAFKTLRQLAEVERGTEKVAGYFLVQCSIDDAPAMAFRGIHLCIFPETELWDIEKQIRLAAYHKYNYAVIELWGNFPFDSHPDFCWADQKVDKGEVKRLIRLGRELGITLIPQLNLLGHAAYARAVSCKHAVLDFNPALQPLFEPDGWTWCISNPETRRIQTDLALELYDFFEQPPFFHIGCDEAYNIGTCRDCRKQVLSDLVRDHILYYRNLFRERNTRVIMWHDMLILEGDPRWNGYVACGQAEHHLDQLYRELPRDIIIADWQYWARPDEKATETEQDWATTRFFKNENFDVLVCPWLDRPGIKALGAFAAKENLLGLLETTWHISHDKEFSDTLGNAAFAAWNPEVNPMVTLASRMALSHHLRQIGWDMNVCEYRKTGSIQYQVDPGHHPHSLS